MTPPSLSPCLLPNNHSHLIKDPSTKLPPLHPHERRRWAGQGHQGLEGKAVKRAVPFLTFHSDIKERCQLAEKKRNITLLELFQLHQPFYFSFRRVLPMSGAPHLIDGLTWNRCQRFTRTQARQRIALRFLHFHFLKVRTMKVPGHAVIRVSRLPREIKPIRPQRLAAAQLVRLICGSHQTYNSCVSLSKTLPFKVVLDRQKEKQQGKCSSFWGATDYCVGVQFFQKSL